MSVNFTYAPQGTKSAIPVNAVHHGQCHCGGVKFSVRLPDGLGDVARCNCSLCLRKGAVMAFVDMAQFTIEEGQDLLSLYQFNTGVAKHYFCSRCGVYTHHQRRSIPTQYAFNIACLDGVNPYELASVPVIDGKGSHPSDK